MKLLAIYALSGMLFVASLSFAADIEVWPKGGQKVRPKVMVLIYMILITGIKGFASDCFGLRG